MKIKKGRNYLCTEDVIMDNGTRDYTEGKVYLSEEDGYLTDDEGDTSHSWDGEDCPSTHFELLPRVNHLSAKEQFDALVADSDVSLEYRFFNIHSEAIVMYFSYSESAGEIALWDSENDGRKFVEELDSYEDLGDYLRRQIKEVRKRLKGCLKAKN